MSLLPIPPRSTPLPEGMDRFHAILLLREAQVVVEQGAQEFICHALYDAQQLMEKKDYKGYNDMLSETVDALYELISARLRYEATYISWLLEYHNELWWGLRDKGYDEAYNQARRARVEWIEDLINEIGEV